MQGIVKKKVALTILILIAVVLSIFFVIPIPKTVEKDLYEYYVSQCEKAHVQNMSYSYCSGWWCEPEEAHLSNPCVIHPDENLREEIPHGSPLARNIRTKIVFGIYGYVTTKYY